MKLKSVLSNSQLFQNLSHYYNIFHDNTVFVLRKNSAVSLRSMSELPFELFIIPQSYLAIIPNKITDITIRFQN